MFRHGTEAAMKVSVVEALRTRGDAALDIITDKLPQMVTRKIWTPVHAHQLTDLERGRIIRSTRRLGENSPSGTYLT
jgi:hypothetical protein